MQREHSRDWHNRVLFRLAVVLITATPMVQSAEAQPANSLLKIITASIQASLPDPPATSARQYSMSAAMNIPNASPSDARFGTDLTAFDRIPSENGALGSPDTPQIPGVLKRIAAQVEFSKLELTDDEKNTLEKTTALLKSPTLRTPTAEYKKYQEYEAQFSNLSAQLAAASDQASRLTLLQRIRQVERDWKLFGYRDQIDTALATIKSLQGSDGPRLFADWARLIEQEAIFDADQLSVAFVQANWVRVAVSSDAIRAEALTIASAPAQLKLPPLSRVAFEFTVQKISRPALSHPFLADTSWRTRDGFILSDGNPSSSSPSELLPRIVTSVLLIKNLEISFQDEMSRDALSALTTPTSASFSGIPLSSTGTQLFVQTRFVSWNGAYIVGYFVEPITKTPNPSPGRSWSK